MGTVADTHYQYQGLIAFLLTALFFYLYSLSTCWRWYGRFIYGCLLAVVLYWIAGPIALLFGISILLYDLLIKSNRWYCSLLPVALIIIIEIISVECGCIGDFRQAFLPDFYYEARMTPPSYYIVSWLLLPISMLIIYLFKFAKPSREILDIVLCLIGTIIITWVCISLSLNRINPSAYQLLKLSHYTALEQWDKVLETSGSSDTNNYLVLNYQNLALSHKGMLLEHLFEYPQSGPMSLTVSNNKSKEICQLLSQIYFQMGNVAAAQYQAFESNVGVEKGYNPTLMKILVQTNLIFGAYPVAEKYISMLEQTWGYKEWASSQRRFLYNDKAVAQDSILGPKRRDIPQRENFVMKQGPFVDLDFILETNPNDKAAIDYAISYLLLAKDMKDMEYFINKYQNSPSLTPLPKLLQEALISIKEKDLNYCLKHGVSEETLQRYQDYKQKFIACRSEGRDPSSFLMAEYGASYWYYLMFKK
jgi:hypothetical protein